MWAYQREVPQLLGGALAPTLCRCSLPVHEISPAAEEEEPHQRGRLWWWVGAREGGRQPYAPVWMCLTKCWRRMSGEAALGKEGIYEGPQASNISGLLLKGPPPPPPTGCCSSQAALAELRGCPRAPFHGGGHKGQTDLA